MIKLGLIGYGYWGPNLARNFSEISGATLASIADREEGKLDLVRRRYPAVRTTLDCQELIADPDLDAIAIATPVSSHFVLAMAALQAGKHVWIEKPMAETSHQARALANEAEKRGRILYVDHTFIYTSAVKKIAQIVESEDLGRLLYYDSTRINLGLFQKDVSVISDLAVHDFSILQYIMRERPVAVSASGTNHFPGTQENLAYITVFYDSGTIAHINVSWLAPVKVRQILIGGSKKMIVYDDLEQSEKVKVYDKGVSFTEDANQIHEMRVGYRTGDMWAPKLASTEALRSASEHFISCIGRKTVPDTDGRFGADLVQVIEAATTSMRNRGETVFIKPQVKVA